MAGRKIVDEAAVVAMLEAGATPLEVASTLDVSEGHTRRLLSRYKLDTPAIRKRLEAHRAAVTERCRQGFADFQALKVPEWVKRADLEADYRDTARDFGEEAAARHCRSLLRDQREMEALDARLRRAA
jgi:hypothetical protein